MVGCSRTGPSRDFLAESTKHRRASEDLARSPIGDDIHCDVYSFIKDYLLESQKERKERDTRELVQSEMENYLLIQKDPKKYLLKTYLACVVETEFSHILDNLCNAHPWCYQIVIFSRDGVCIGLSHSKNGVTFKEKDDIYEYLGFLYPNATRRIRTEKLTRIWEKHTKLDNSPKYFRVVRAIYYNESRDYAYFLSKRKGGDNIIGYVLYIVGIGS